MQAQAVDQQVQQVGVSQGQMQGAVQMLPNDQQYQPNQNYTPVVQDVNLQQGVGIQQNVQPMVNMQGMQMVGQQGAQGYPAVGVQGAIPNTGVQSATTVTGVQAPTAIPDMNQMLPGVPGVPGAMPGLPGGMPATVVGSPVPSAPSGLSDLAGKEFTFGSERWKLDATGKAFSIGAAPPSNPTATDEKEREGKGAEAAEEAAETEEPSVAEATGEQGREEPGSTKSVRIDVKGPVAPPGRIGLNIRADITRTIGGTPLVFLNRVTEGCFGQVAVKLETANPFCSSTDRVALGMIEDAEQKKLITPGETILIEATTGNTGISLAGVAAVRGYSIMAVMPENMSLERRCLLAAFGADIVLTPGSKGMDGAITKAKHLAASLPNSYFFNQYSSDVTAKVHRETTGPEIWADTEGLVDVFVAGVGTGGTLTGVAEFLKSRNSNCRIVAVEPQECAALSGSEIKLNHKITGLGTGFVPKAVGMHLIDEFFNVRSEQALEMARKLPRNEGLLACNSGGAAIFAAVEIAKKPESEGQLIVVSVPGNAEREISTSLFDDIRVICTNCSPCPPNECM